jgi:aminoglycoside phosphotransferase (APT) family kinase protein
VEKERVWLPRLAPHLPLVVPEILATGSPGEGYPWPWAVHRWIPGESAAQGRIGDPCEAANDLAGFVRALHRIDASAGPRAGVHGLRGAPLATRDAATRRALVSLRGTLDIEAATQVWEAALRAPEWRGAPVWFHGDLLPGNLLFAQGRLRAVIDFGGLGVGDPACDLMSAWGLFSGASREAFRAALGADEATWARGRGHALSQALIFLPYYRDTHPEGVRIARRTIDEILADPGSAAGPAPVSTGASR